MGPTRGGLVLRLPLPDELREVGTWTLAICYACFPRVNVHTTKHNSYINCGRPEDWLTTMFLPLRIALDVNVYILHAVVQADSTGMQGPPARWRMIWRAARGIWLEDSGNPHRLPWPGPCTIQGKTAFCWQFTRGSKASPASMTRCSTKLSCRASATRCRSVRTGTLSSKSTSFQSAILPGALWPQSSCSSWKRTQSAR